MKIIRDFPPIYEEICKAFPNKPKGCCYAWGDVIYSPETETLDPSIIAHEAVHGQRQGKDVLGWWKRYIEDPRFRTDEEILGHQAEFEFILKNGNRHQRRAALDELAKRLASPMYGSMIGKAQARKELSKILLKGIGTYNEQSSTILAEGTENASAILARAQRLFAERQ